ncbi:MAG TPA: hypothetical protein VGE45_18560 [Chloroflexia bacterium]
MSVSLRIASVVRQEQPYNINLQPNSTSISCHAVIASFSRIRRGLFSSAATLL